MNILQLLMTEMKVSGFDSGLFFFPNSRLLVV